MSNAEQAVQGDSPGSFFSRLGQYGLSLTTVLTVCLFFLGYCYWVGYFSHYHVDVWSFDIPFLRYLVPSLPTIVLIATIVVNYVSAYWMSKVEVAASPVVEGESTVIARLGLDAAYFKQFRRESTAFNVASHKQQILTMLHEQ